MQPFGNIWSHLESSAGTWNHLEVSVATWGHLESSGGMLSHLEAPRKQPGGSQETPRKLPGDTQEAPRAPEYILKPDLRKMLSLSNGMPKVPGNVNFAHDF